MICKTLHRKLNFELSICSSITAAPAYEIKQKFSVNAIWECASYQDFVGRWLLLTEKLQNPAFICGKVEATTSKWIRKDIDEHARVCNITPRHK